MEVKRKLDWISKIGIGLILVCVILLIYLFCCALVFFRKKEVPLVLNSCSDYYKVADEVGISFQNISGNNRTRKEYRKFVEDDLEVGFYIYTESNKLPEGKAGVTLATIRTIVMDSNSSSEYAYCVAITHELMHLKHFVQAERFICWQTFLYLWESEELHNVGVWYAYHLIYGYYRDEYNISDLVVDYLTNK